MSNRKMGEFYGRNRGGMSTTPGSGILGLIDMITGRPEKEEEKQRNFLSDMMDKQARLEKELMSSDVLKELALRKNVAMEDIAGPLSKVMLENAMQSENLTSNSLQGPEAQRASDAGVNASLLRNNDKGIPGGFLGPQITPQGSTSGFYDPFNATGVTKVTGGTKKQMSTTTGGFTDPKTGITIPGKPIAIEQDIPGGMFPPVNPDVVNETIAKNDAQSQNGISTTPWQGPPAPSVPSTGMSTTPPGNPFNNALPQAMRVGGKLASGLMSAINPVSGSLVDPSNTGRIPSAIRGFFNTVGQGANTVAEQTGQNLQPAQDKIKGIMDLIREYVLGNQQAQ